MIVPAAQRRDDGGGEVISGGLHQAQRFCTEDELEGEGAPTHSLGFVVVWHPKEGGEAALGAPPPSFLARWEKPGGEAPPRPFPFSHLEEKVRGG